MDSWENERSVARTSSISTPSEDGAHQEVNWYCTIITLGLQLSPLQHGNTTHPTPDAFVCLGKQKVHPMGQSHENLSGIQPTLLVPAALLG